MAASILPSSGRSIKGRLILEGFEDCLQDGFGVGEGGVVVEAEDLEALFAEVGVSLLVSFWVFGVLASVEFDDEARAEAGEVCDVWADGSLAAEAVSVELASAEVGPEMLFGFRGVLAEFSGEVRG